MGIMGSKPAAASKGGAKPTKETSKKAAAKTTPAKAPASTAPAKAAAAVAPPAPAAPAAEAMPFSPAGKGKAKAKTPAKGGRTPVAKAKVTKPTPKKSKTPGRQTPGRKAGRR
jgi:hypothetical protein